MSPSNAIAAASHADPYPYYRELLAGPALVFDADLRLWIASRAAVVAEIMAHPQCVVRPPAEAVPTAIAGSSAGAVFARLVRMNEGAAHASARQVIGQSLAAVDLAAVAQRSAQCARSLDDRHALTDGAAITRWLFDLPTYVVAGLLGFGDAELPQVALLVADFVRCLSPLSTAAQLASASTAAHSLMELMKAPAPGTLADDVRRCAAEAGWEDSDAITANLVGLMSQTHEATAGLIGNSVVTLLRKPALLARLRADPQLVGAFVQEVARYDPSVQNTRRFVTDPIKMAGVALQPGDTILLLLAAAGRDASANPQADVFLLERAARRQSGFGHGRHACPGQDLAFAIATSAIEHLLALQLNPEMLGWTYAPSANARLPQFFSSPLKA